MNLKTVLDKLSTYGSAPDCASWSSVDGLVWDMDVKGFYGDGYAERDVEYEYGVVRGKARTS